MATPSLPARAAALAPIQAVLADDALVLRLGTPEPHDDLLPLFRPEAGTHFLRVRLVGPHTAPSGREGLRPGAPLLAACAALERLRSDWRGPPCDLVVGPAGVAWARPGDPEDCGLQGVLPPSAADPEMARLAALLPEAGRGRLLPEIPAASAHDRLAAETEDGPVLPVAWQRDRAPGRQIRARRRHGAILIETRGGDRPPRLLWAVPAGGPPR